MRLDRLIRGLDLILVLQSFENCCHVEGVCNSSWTLVQNMSVDYRCFAIFHPHSELNNM